MSDSVILALAPDEHASLRAALALYIALGYGDPDQRPDYIHDLATGMDDLAPQEVISLAAPELEKLAEKLTTTAPAQAVLLATPLEIGGGEAPSTAAVLSTGAVLAQQAVDRWASGDLASAINALDEWAEEVRTALPGLDYGDDEEDLQAADEEAYMAARGWTPESFAETVKKIEGDAE